MRFEPVVFIVDDDCAGANSVSHWSDPMEFQRRHFLPPKNFLPSTHRGAPAVSSPISA